MQEPVNSESIPLLGPSRKSRMKLASESVLVHEGKREFKYHSSKMTLYPRRWGILGIIAFLQIASASHGIMYAPVADSLAAYFNCSTTVINGLSQTYLATYLVMAFIAPWQFVRFGLRGTLKFAAAINALGAVLKIGAAFLPDAKAALIATFVSQSICGLGQVAILSCPTLFVALWCGDSERAIFNMLGSVANPVGMAITSLVSPAILGIADSNKEDFQMLSWIIAIPSVIALFLVLGFVLDKPPTPPSASANEDSDSFIVGLKKCFQSTQYIILMLSFGLGAGVLNSTLTLMEQLMASKNFTNDDAGNVAAAVIGCGLLGAACSGIFVDKTKRFQETVKILFFIAVGAAVGFQFALQSGRMLIIMIVSSVLGFMAFGILPVALELAVECTFPVNEGTSAGFLWVTVQVSSIIIISVMDALKGENNDQGHPDMTNSCWFMVACVGVSAILISFFKTRYKRMEDEEIKYQREKGIAVARMSHTSYF